MVVRCSDGFHTCRVCPQDQVSDTNTALLGIGWRWYHDCYRWCGGLLLVGLPINNSIVLKTKYNLYTLPHQYYEDTMMKILRYYEDTKILYYF